MQNYMAYVNFGSFLGAEEMVLDKNDDGEKIEGVFIPYRGNGLTRLGNGIYGRFYVTEKISSDKKGYTHYLKPCMSPDEKKRFVEELGYEVPYVGYMKPTAYKPFYGQVGGRATTSFVKRRTFKKEE